MKKFSIQLIVVLLLGVVLGFTAPHMHTSHLISPQISDTASTGPETPRVLSAEIEGEQNPTPVLRHTPTFHEMDAQYGPCAVIPTLFYHHIEDLNQAATEKHKLMTVSPTIFRQQMEYLKSHGYTVIGMQALINFFDQGTTLPPKPALLTFDDGYDDVGKNAAPILQGLGLNAVFFIPTGLMENPGYMTWDNLVSFPSSIEMANHTWSHHDVENGSEETIMREISTADRQLADRKLNNPKVFAYPHGASSPAAEKILTGLDYKLAFTTIHGSILCKGKRLELPRIRIGNTQLSAYGL